MDILDQYVSNTPSDQASLDLFEDQWSSAMPNSHSHLTAGKAKLFEDSRVTWMIDQLGGLDGQRILELGPLEGGHSYMLEQAGAESILALEANTRAFLKCLIVKNIFDLSKTRFLLGDFMAFLREDEDPFDLALACGVLYHMREPLALLGSLASHTDRIFIWTHYYDDQVINQRPELAGKFSGEQIQSYGEFSCTVHQQFYEAALDWQGFCGGSAEFSYWMKRADILGLLSHLGLTRQSIAFEQPDHQNGPAFCILAQRS
ncbi:MAG: class I SAM-dependent methyltransferase [Wenzhouxiangellaceae bacterium]